LKQTEKNVKSLSTIASEFGAEISKRMRMTSNKFKDKVSTSTTSSSMTRSSSFDSEISTNADSAHNFDSNLEADPETKVIKRLPTLPRNGSEPKIFVVRADNEINKNV
jgi:hypothetical protein